MKQQLNIQNLTNYNIKSINLIYSTQTGTSYDLSKSFYLSYYNKIHINKFINIQQIQQFSQQQSNNLFIFFISTTGQGDFTYSMRNLWKKMLNKSFNKLQWMKFTIYSFGDRSYGDNFCIAARKFRQRLIGLGAEEVIQIGLGDQQQPNGYLQEYRDKWLPNLINFFTVNGLLIQTNIQNLPIQSQQKQVKQSINNNPHNATMKILARKQICSNKGRRTFTIDLQIQKYMQKICTGDILSIYPYNDPNDIQYLMKFFNLQQDSLYVNCLTYKQLFRQYVNISSSLNHSFFISRPDIKNLSEYCSNQLYKAKLVELEQDYDQYHNYIKKYKRNVVEVLRDFEMHKLPVEEFVKRCNDIVPRKYSISQVLENNEQSKLVRIMFRLVNHKINQNRIHKGLCSHDMALWANIGDRRKINVLKGEFQYIQKKQNNLIFISLGTGIAPFVQFMDIAKKSSNIWNLNLFYTNRYQNQVYFQQSLQLLVEQNKLNPFLSFTGQGGKRIIRLVEDNIEQISKIIQKSNNQYKIMICGPKQVCEGMQNILGKGLGLDFKILKKKKMFIYENW